MVAVLSAVLSPSDVLDHSQLISILKLALWRNQPNLVVGPIFQPNWAKKTRTVN